MQATFTTKQLERRAARIIRGVRTGRVPTKSDALAELVELVEAIEDEPVKPVVVARLTVTRASGRRTIVEVREGSTWSAFYRIFHQDGARRSTKKWVRTGGRHEAPDLAALLERMKNFAVETNPVIYSKLRIIKKRAYRKLVNARPDELGLVQMKRLPIYSPFAARSS